MKLHIIVDSNQLCYRSFHSLDRDLSYGDVPTNIIFGFLNQIVSIQDLFSSTNTIFAFDFGRVLRKDIYPEYKKPREDKRKELSEEEKTQYKEMRNQVRQLRTDILKRIGYRNIFYQKGYESDDVIASLCHNTIPKEDNAVIISSDGDLYQLLTERIFMYDPTHGKRISLKSFQKRYGVGASQWADVKAMAGCTTDNVEGIRGIGEKTAAKFLNSQLKPESVAHKKVIEGRDVWNRNLPLVQLPYEGTETFKLRRNRATNDKWESICDEFGLNSLKRENPFDR